MMRGLLLAIAVSQFGAVPAAAQESPRAFVERLYARYYRNGPGVDRTKIFAPELARLEALDAEQSKGEAGFLDYDPICSCQDWDVITIRWLGLAQTQKTAVARLVLSYGPSISPQRPQPITLHLSRGARGWLIADIGAPEMPSLRAALTDYLKPKGRKP